MQVFVLFHALLDDLVVHFAHAFQIEREPARPRYLHLVERKIDTHKTEERPVIECLEYGVFREFLDELVLFFRAADLFGDARHLHSRGAKLGAYHDRHISVMRDIYGFS